MDVVCCHLSFGIQFPAYFPVPSRAAQNFSSPQTRSLPLSAGFTQQTQHNHAHGVCRALTSSSTWTTLISFDSDIGCTADVCMNPQQYALTNNANSCQSCNGSIDQGLVHWFRFEDSSTLNFDSVAGIGVGDLIQRTSSPNASMDFHECRFSWERSLISKAKAVPIQNLKLN